MKSVFIFAALATFASGACAQTNILGNGDFERSTTLIAPWRISGFAINPAIEKYSTTGCGPSNAYAATITSTVHTLWQPVKLSKGKRYSFTLAFGHTQASRSGSLSIEARYRGKTKSVRIKEWRTSIGRGQDLWNVGDSFAPLEDATTFELRFRFFGTGLRMRIDDVRLAPADVPQLSSYSSRGVSRWGGTNPLLLLTSHGQPGTANIILLSPKGLVKGVAIPGFQGRLRLAPSAGIFVFAVVPNDANGNGKFALRLSQAQVRALIGVPLYFQPLAFNPILGVKSFGWPACMGWIK